MQRTGTTTAAGPFAARRFNALSLKHFLQGRWMHHPLHAFLVHLPVGLWIGSLVFDTLGMLPRAVAKTHFYADAAYHLIALGVLGAGLSAITGWAEFWDIPSGSLTQRIALTHAALNIVSVISYVAQLIVRRNLATVTFGTFVWNLLQIGVLGFSGWLGGKMVYQLRMGARPVKGLNSLFAGATTTTTTTGYAAQDDARSNLREAVSSLKTHVPPVSTTTAGATTTGTTSAGLVSPQNLSPQADFRSFQAIPGKTSAVQQPGLFQSGSNQPLAG